MWSVGVATLALVALCAAHGADTTVGSSALLSAGVTGYSGHRSTLPADSTARFLPGTALLGEAGAPAAAFPVATDPRNSAQSQRAWLASGVVLGRTTGQREVAARALLDLDLLTSPDGAAAAAPFGAWEYVWPRDASWYVAAFAATGHADIARSILNFLTQHQNPDGTWAARYHLDGNPVRDGRAAQSDAMGWFCWAAWSAARADPAGTSEATWQAVERAADAAVAQLRPDDLPNPSADYWERPERRPTLGTAAPLLLGLRSAADLARGRGANRESLRWADAARRLGRAVSRRFGPTGYGRHPDERRPDAAVAFLSPALAPLPPTAGVQAATTAAEQALLTPSGGLRPGGDARIGNVAWTAETALFLLADAGEDARFDHWFDWLTAHRTGPAEFPEKVTDAGAPASVAPLGWTDAIVLLALAARDGRVPTPPEPDLR